MKLVAYIIVLNHHQAPVADELYNLLGNDYCFVELVNRNGHNKGGTTDYSKRPYLLRAWESQESFTKAMELAKTAEVCIFSGVQSLPFIKERMKLGLLSFDVSERWLKKGIKNVLSPAISKQFIAYWIGRWDKKPLYKLCQSAFAAGDHNRLGMYKNKCFKWAYFTSVSENNHIILNENRNEPIRIMWCARFIRLKHPELPIKMAKKLKDNGYNFILDFYGGGPEEEPSKTLAQRLNVEDIVTFHGAKPNNEILEAMREHEIFLFTSNQLEGWGAVINEAMANGCAVVSADCIGSTPYLVSEGVTGFSFKEGNVDSLVEKVQCMLDHPEHLTHMRMNALNQMQTTWNARIAAKNLLQLTKDLQQSKDVSIVEGPCSKA